MSKRPRSLRRLGERAPNEGAERTNLLAPALRDGQVGRTRQPKGIAMDVIEKIRQLVALMNEQNLTELEVEEPEFKVRIKVSQGEQYMAQAIPETMQHLEAPREPPALQQGPEPAVTAPPTKKETLAEITSPMVGTFYRSSSEGGEPYVTVGTVVEPDMVICIVEAMKVMNEVKAELSGEVVEILVQNAEPVEYGQVLFLVRPIEGQ